VNEAWGERLVRLHRGRVARWALLRVLPRAISVRFDPSAATDLDATLGLAIRDPYGRPTAHYALTIADSRCSVRPGAPAAPGARATIGSDDLIRLVSGTVSWPELLSSGRFDLTGDPFLALRFASLFQLPVVLDPVRPAP
jgi:hypothetical protein